MKELLLRALGQRLPSAPRGKAREQPRSAEHPPGWAPCSRAPAPCRGTRRPVSFMGYCRPAVQVKAATTHARLFPNSSSVGISQISKRQQSTGQRESLLMSWSCDKPKLNTPILQIRHHTHAHAHRRARQRSSDPTRLNVGRNRMRQLLMVVAEHSDSPWRFWCLLHSSESH